MKLWTRVRKPQNCQILQAICSLFHKSATFKFPEAFSFPKSFFHEIRSINLSWINGNVRTVHRSLVHY